MAAHPGTQRFSSAFNAENWLQFESNGYSIRTLAPFKGFRGLDIPWDSPQELDATTERIVKVRLGRRLVKLAAGHFASPLELYVKRYNFKTWYGRILRAARKTRAREEFDLAWKLMSKGIRTPRPVWLAEDHCALPRFSLLATEALPNAESLVERWKRLDHDGQRRELLEALGRFAWRVHDCGFYHDSFRAAHVLVSPRRPSLPEEFFLIDLLGGSFPHVLSRLRRAKNLYQILRSFQPKDRSWGLTPEHRELFLLSYSAGSAPEALRWSRWVDRVGRLKGRRLR